MRSEGRGVSSQAGGVVGSSWSDTGVGPSRSEREEMGAVPGEGYDSDSN